MASRTSRRGVRRGRPSRRGGGMKRCNKFPFAVGQIACIPAATPFILASSDFGPGHVILVQCRNRTESQLTEITQLFSGRALSVVVINISEMMTASSSINALSAGSQAAAIAFARVTNAGMVLGKRCSFMLLYRHILHVFE